jgi:peptide/nickel transport system permease protein
MSVAVGSEAVVEAAPTLDARPRRRRALDAEARIGAGLVLVLAAAFAVVPRLTPYGSSEIVTAPLQAPSSAHPFGTDAIGRDMLTRVFAAGLTDLSITALSVTLCLAIGTTVGVVVGTLRSARLRSLALRVVDAVLAFPFIIIVLTLIVALGERRIVPLLSPRAGTITVAIAVVGWATYARLATTTTLALRDRESVIAARLLGYSRARVLAVHVLPSVLGVCLSYAATQATVTTAVIASLAFLGAGVPEPTPELGAMMQQGIALLTTSWWVTLIPGAVVLALGVGFALIADSLSERR